MNRKLLLSAASEVKPIEFPPDSLVLYSESEFGRITILNSWENMDDVSNAANVISCINEINGYSEFPKTTKLHMFFNVKEFKMQTSNYTTFTQRYPTEVHGLGIVDTLITITAASTRERLFKTATMSPIWFKDFKVMYWPTTYQPDKDVIELDAGGPVHVENVEISGFFRRGFLSHLSNIADRAAQSTIKNLHVYAYEGYGADGSFVLDRQSKFGKIEDLVVSNTGTAIKINTVEHPFDMSATIYDNGSVILGGDGATYNLTWGDWGTDDPAKLGINASNSTINYERRDEGRRNPPITVVNNGNCNIINGEAGFCINYKMFTITIIEDSTNYAFPNYSIRCLEVSTSSSIDSKSRNGDGSVTFPLVPGETYEFQISDYKASYTAENSEPETVIWRVDTGIEMTIFWDDGEELALPTAYRPGERIDPLPRPTKSGYTFAGWYDQSGTMKYEAPLIATSSSLRLYAKWVEGTAETTLTLQLVDSVTGYPISGERISGIDENGNNLSSALTTDLEGKATWTNVEVGTIYNFRSDPPVLEDTFVNLAKEVVVTSTEPATMVINPDNRYVERTTLNYHSNGGIKFTPETPIPKSVINAFPGPFISDWFVGGWYDESLTTRYTTPFVVSASVDNLYPNWLAQGQALSQKTLTIKIVEVTSNFPVYNWGIECTEVSSGDIIPNLATNIDGEATWTSLVVGRAYVFKSDTYVYQVVKVLDTDLETITIEVDDSSKNTFTYHSNGGTECPEESHMVNAVITKLQRPGRADYIFKGWFSDANLTSPVVLPVISRQNMDLYAKWEEGVEYKTVTIKVLAAGTTYPVTGLLLKCMEPVSADVPNLTTDIHGEATYTNLEVGTSYYFSVPQRVSVTITPTNPDPETIITYASDSFYTGNLIWCSNGGTEYPVETELIVGTVIETFPIPTKEGYTFVGWFDQRLTTQYEAPLVLQRGDNELYAQWDPPSFHSGGTIG